MSLASPALPGGFFTTSSTWEVHGPSKGQSFCLLAGKFPSAPDMQGFTELETVFEIILSNVFIL